MPLQQPASHWYVPDETPDADALQRTTLLGVGAHQDDLEFMALHGILAAYDHSDEWFGGITCTDGGGSARTGRFADYTDEEMKAVRAAEQNEAARLGQYSFMAQLGYPSHMIKQAHPAPLVDELESLLIASQPRVIYTHNPADKHATHIGVLRAVLQAIRRLPLAQRPRQLLGCEVWRDLDWLDDQHKVVLDVSRNEALAKRLNACFASQIEGGKRYDLAVAGRQRANATFMDSHATDTITRAWFAMDCTPLIVQDDLDPVAFVQSHIDRFKADVMSKWEGC